MTMRKLTTIAAIVSIALVGSGAAFAGPEKSENARHRMEGRKLVRVVPTQEPHALTGTAMFADRPGDLAFVEDLCAFVSNGAQ